MALARLDVTVIVATYGDWATWEPLAERAVRSVPPEVECRRWHEDRGDIASTRNNAAGQALTEWLCFLDADDELEPGYMEAMAEVDFDLRSPLVRWVPPGGRGGRPARIPAGPTNMQEGNRLVIGTLVRAEMFHGVGGFKPWPLYEDWDLWQRCWLQGATIGFSRAVYRAHMRRGSRNRAPASAERTKVHHAIRSTNMPWLYAGEPAAAR